MDRLQSMNVFKHVVAENGFAAGARKLGLSPAQVTRTVQHLEDHLGVQLLRRTTRRLALTAAGETYLDRVRAILSDVDAAAEAAHSHACEISGKIRVRSLPGMPTHLVAPAIAEFRRQHPKVIVDLSSDAQPLRDIEGHDITLLMDDVPLPGDAVVRPVFDSHSVLCASPSYIRLHGAPRTPQCLQDHALVRFVMPGVASHALKLIDENGDETREQRIDVQPVLTCNDHEAVLRSTLQGAGISSQAMHVAAPLLRSGQLQRVLSPWISERCTLVATYAGHRHMPARMRAFLDHLVQYAQQAKADIDTPRSSA
jgi:DNA-binding transcriptional LysR family regulator